MSMTLSPSTRRTLRIAGIAAIVLILLVVLAWWYGTSNAFFQRFVLPRISQKLGARVEVGHAQIRPLRSVVLSEIRMRSGQAGEDRPILEAREIRVRYHLFRLLRGQVDLDELTVESPQVHLTVDAEGRSNWGAILESLQSPRGEPGVSEGTAVETPVIRVGRVAIRDAALSYRREAAGSRTLELAIEPLDLEVQNLATDQSGSSSLRFRARARQTDPGQPATNRLELRLETRAAFALGKGTLPRDLTLDGRAEVTDAAGDWQVWTNFQTLLTARLGPGQSNEFVIRLTQSGDALATLAARGSLPWQTPQADLNIELTGPDSRLLNRIGSMWGFDFGRSQVNAQARLTTDPAHPGIGLTLQGGITSFQARKGDLATPVTDVETRLRVFWNRVANTLRVEEFQLAARQETRTWLEGTLPAPIEWNPAQGLSAAPDSGPRLSITDLDLADWRPILGNLLPAGKVRVELDLRPRPGTSDFVLFTRGEVREASLRFGERSWRALAASWELPVHLSRQADWTLTNGWIRLRHEDRPLLEVEASGTGSLSTAAMAWTLTASPPAWLALLQPEAAPGLRTGELQTRLEIRRAGRTLETRGELALRQLDGGWFPKEPPSPELAATFDLHIGPARWEARTLNARFTAGGLPAGTIELHAVHQPTNGACSFTARVDRLSQAVAAPLLAAVSDGLQLASLECSAEAAGDWNPGGLSRIRLGLAVTNIGFRTGTDAPVTESLAAGLDADLAISPREFRVNRFRALLDPRPDQPNEVRVQGGLQRAAVGVPWKGTIEVQTPDLDLTRGWTVWESLRRQPTDDTAAPPEAGPKEPAPVRLPVDEGRLRVALGKVRLRELILSNAVVEVLLHTNRVQVSQCEALLNGAPLRASAEVDLSVPGYRYQVAFSADAVPLPPLVSTFTPEHRDSLAGTATAALELQGLGLTGANLQKHLRGQASLAATNLNLAIGQVRSPLLQTVLNVILGLPDLIRNPAAGVTRMVGQLLGAPGSRSGWTDRLLSAPIEAVTLQARAADGQIRIADAEILSPAFLARARGNVTLAADLAQSELHLPVQVALERTLAAEIGRTGEAGTTYVALPDFLTVRGTLAAPRADLDKLALVGLATTGGAAVLRNVGSAAAQQAGNVLGALGQLLGGGTQGNQTASTNPPTAPATAPLTNPPPATDATTVTNPPVQRILDLFRPPR